jgi:hypothetical protein
MDRNASFVKVILMPRVVGRFFTTAFLGLVLGLMCCYFITMMFLTFGFELSANVRQCLQAVFWIWRFFEKFGGWTGSSSRM